MRPIALSSAQHRRLERLARDAGRSTEQMLRFVLRDGFEYCEWQVRQSLAADAEARRLGTTPHDVVMREARELIELARGRRRRQAA
jgi:predicted transcriptional regulator